MRIWHGRDNDDGSIHSMGNGKLCVYGQGPDIVQIFGPPYSSPTLMEMHLLAEDVTVESRRMTGTAVWTHSLSNESEFTDFVDSDAPCFVRKINSNSALKFILKVDVGVELFENTKLFKENGFSGGYIVYSPGGRAYYNDYPLDKKIYFQLLVKNAETAITQDGVEITADGLSEIYIIGGMDYPDLCLNTEKIMQTNTDTMLAATIASWQEFSGRRIQLESALDNNMPLKSEFLESLDAVSVCIKAQQSVEGGVLAGHNFRLAYVRDQYGVFRCLLKLELFEEAKAMLSFYWDIWKKKGAIYTAQPAGEPNRFHVHENDDVEITGYLILQCFDYLVATNDDEMLREIYPMMIWAFDRQKRHLVNGMLPFNGDETYIAGGVLPRTCLNDGSADSTMLFITGGEKLINWLEENKLYSGDMLQEAKSALSDARSRYRDNFFKDGVFITNNPDRKKYIELPRFRHGVCEGCLTESGHHPLFFGWTEINENGRYLCASCKVNKNLEKAEDIVYVLQSVSLIPLYIGSDLLTNEELTKLVDVIAEQYKKTGSLPSRPNGNTTVGYDYGLLLYTLAALDHPLADEIYRKTLEVADQTAVWVEYYIDGVPKYTRCRPWESGINLEALINYGGKQWKQKD